MNELPNKKNIKQIFLKYLPYIILFLVTFLLYAKTISFNITDNDDASFIHGNSAAYGSQTLIKDIFTNNVIFGGYSAYYRPLLTLSFALEHKLAGASPSFAHLTNIMLHICCCFMIFFFFKKYLMSSLAAFIAAVIFAVHPANIYAVTWIPGRNDSLFFIFFLPALIFFTEYLDKRMLKFLFLHAVFFMALLFTKESALIMPFVLILFSLTHKKNGHALLTAYACLFAVWIIEIIIFMLLKNNAMPESSILTALSNSINFSNISMFFEYYQSMFFLTAPFGANITFKTFFFGAAALLLAAYLAFFCCVNSHGKKRAEMFFYFVLPFILLAPTMMTTRIWFQGNRMYLPLFAVLAICFVRFDISYCRYKRYNKPAFFSILVFILLCSFITSAKSDIFKNAMTFWSAVYKDFKKPPIIIENHYAAALLRFGYPDEALPAIQNAAKSSNNLNTPALFNLANYYLLKGNYEKAAVCFEATLNNPVLADAETYANLFLCAKFTNNEEAAKFYYMQTVKKLNSSAEEANEFISDIHKNLQLAQKAYNERIKQ